MFKNNYWDQNGCSESQGSGRIYVILIKKWIYILKYYKVLWFSDETWGYMNMLPHEGYFLNITALKTTQQPSNNKCIVDCIETTDCFSINAVQKLNNTVQCQLLSGNKHRNSTEYVTLTESTHFYIPVSFLFAKRICYKIKRNYKDLIQCQAGIVQNCSKI